MKRLIGIGGGEPEFDTPKHIVDAMKKAIDDGHTHYGSFAGISELKEAIAAKYQAYGVDVNPEYVIITPGSTMGIYQSLHGITSPGDDFITMNPCFFAYLSTFEFVGVKPMTVPRYKEEGWRIHVDDVAEAVTPKTKGILICSPDNPTGNVLREEELKGLAEIAIDRDLWVISDDIYDMITYDGAEFKSIATLPEMQKRTIILNGFSKAYAMTGWRLGYIIAPDEATYRKLFDIQMSTYLVVNAAVQRAGVAALTGPQDCVHEMVKKYDEKRRYSLDAYSELDGVECTVPEGAMYVFPDMSVYGKTSKELCDYLLKEARVSLTPGSNFGSLGEGHYRQAFAQSFEDISEGLYRIKKALGKF